jgi:hypothetical protein
MAVLKVDLFYKLSDTQVHLPVPYMSAIFHLYSYRIGISLAVLNVRNYLDRLLVVFFAVVNCLIRWYLKVDYHHFIPHLFQLNIHN